MTMLRSASAVTVAVVLLGAAPAARASIATTADGSLRYTAAPGEVNNVTFTGSGGQVFKVVDTGAVIQAGQGCTQDTPNQVTCTTAPGNPIIAQLGDMNDRATSKTGRAVQFFGEAGNDRLAGASGRDLLDGGDGDDIVSGGSGRDTVRGGAGNDLVLGNAGNDVVDGGDGDDLIDGGGGDDSETGGSGNDSFRQGSAPNGADNLDGGDGIDTADYSLRSAPVHVDVNDVADDGDLRTGERDNVRSTIEVVRGGAGSDRLFGRDGEPDTLIGGTGDDYIDGRRGSDSIDGGPGIDQIAARDLSADTITCGDGVDSVAADARDLTASDCEHVRRTASMSIRLERAPIYPTVFVRVTCPLSAFKLCGGQIVVASTGRVRTRVGKRILTVAQKRFLIPPGVQRVVGVRIRGAVAPFIKPGGLEVRARLSGFDGAGPARPAATRFNLRRR